jgi:hypothetical protein
VYGIPEPLPYQFILKGTEVPIGARKLLPQNAIVQSTPSGYQARARLLHAATPTPLRAPHCSDMLEGVARATARRGAGVGGTAC